MLISNSPHHENHPPQELTFKLSYGSELTGFANVVFDGCQKGWYVTKTKETWVFRTEGYDFGTHFQRKLTWFFHQFVQIRENPSVYPMNPNVFFINPMGWMKARQHQKNDTQGWYPPQRRSGKPFPKWGPFKAEVFRGVCLLLVLGRVTYRRRLERVSCQQPLNQVFSWRLWWMHLCRCEWRGFG